MKFFNARVWIIIFGVMGLLGGTLNAIAAEASPRMRGEVSTVRRLM